MVRSETDSADVQKYAWHCDHLSSKLYCDNDTHLLISHITKWLILILYFHLFRSAIRLNSIYVFKRCQTDSASDLMVRIALCHYEPRLLIDYC
jgi:hypothetical protein